MEYVAYHFTVEPKEIGSEILIAELGEKDFESFVETENGVDAFIQKIFDTDDILNDIYILNSEEFNISYTKELIKQINWNQEWEKNFSPIEIDDLCYVRAPFHQPKKVPYEIVIEPKMSFGTGHHETTFMMMKHLLNINTTDMTVLDMGCGTAILAILALMKGAKNADAIDIDHWCYLNSIENAERNGIQNLSVYEGDASLLNNKINHYDLILANINRNILLNDMAQYVKAMKQNGIILFSGFYQEDIPYINAEAQRLGLSLQDSLENNNWVALKYIKTLDE